MPNADYIIPVQIERQIYNCYVLLRPGVHEFLRAVGQVFEVVIFTASVANVRPSLVFASP